MKKDDLKQILIDINYVNDYIGNGELCDCIDNDGKPYPSAYLHDQILKEIISEGIKPSPQLLRITSKEKS